MIRQTPIYAIYTQLTRDVNPSSQQQIAVRLDVVFTSLVSERSQQLKSRIGEVAARVTVRTLSQFLRIFWYNGTRSIVRSKLCVSLMMDKVWRR